MTTEYIQRHLQFLKEARQLKLADNNAPAYHDRTYEFISKRELLMRYFPEDKANQLMAIGVGNQFLSKIELSLVFENSPANSQQTQQSESQSQRQTPAQKPKSLETTTSSAQPDKVILTKEQEDALFNDTPEEEAEREKRLGWAGKYKHY